jgi:uncharacterized protein (DUF3820 family)
MAPHKGSESAMTDPESKPSNVVPFGKYKGRTIEEILVDDPGYMQWLSGQDWFRAKFTFLHQTIINRSAEPEETPEHNAIQVKFLDDDFCLRFLRCMEPDYETEALDKFNLARLSNLDIVQKKIKAEKNAPQEDDAELARKLKDIEEWQGMFGMKYTPKQLADARSTQKIAAHRSRETTRIERGKRLPILNRMDIRLSPSINKIKFNVERKFEEDGVDVALSITARMNWTFDGIEHNEYGSPRDSFWAEDWRNWHPSVGWGQHYDIEIKPTVGDDYPAILRQMRKNKSDILLVGAYGGMGATEDQFVRTMRSASIKVVFLADVV